MLLRDWLLPSLRRDHDRTVWVRAGETGRVARSVRRCNKTFHGCFSLQKMRQHQLTELRILLLAVILAAGAALPTGTVRVDAQTPAAAQLATPGLTAEAAPDGIILRWDAAADAVGYQLATWWDAETGWQTVGGGSLTGTSYTHTEVSAGTTYYYSIRAVGANGETGPWSQWAQAAVPADSG